MNNMDELFPKFQKSIENLIEDEEGNIPGKKLLVMGTMIIVLGSLMQMDVFAGHRSHSSHKSHSSHSSGSSGHGNHGSHGSHVSHTSHSNTSAHSNSAYSSEGDVSYKAPAATAVPSINTPVVTATADTFKIPDVNQNIELPNGTPTSNIMPSLAVPVSSVGIKIDAGEIHQPSATDKVE